MKPTLLLITIFIFTFCNSFGQTTLENKNEVHPEEFKDLYPVNYTFEKAKEFEQKGEYEKAIWFYINLFSANKTKAVDMVVAISVKLDTTDIISFIKSSFAHYVIYDPAVTTFIDSTAYADTVNLRKKINLSEALIFKISDRLHPLSSASEYNLRSIERLKAKNYEGSLDDLNKAIEMKPSGEYYYNRATTKSTMEDFKGAIKDFDKALKFKYLPGETYFYRAYCKDRANDSAGAIKDYTEAIKANNKNSFAYNNRGFVFYKQKKYEEALKDFNKAIELKADNARAYFNRGFVKGDLKDYMGACSDWQKAIYLGDNEAKRYFNKYCK